MQSLPTRSRAPRVGWLAAGALAAASCGGGEPARPPNVLLISVDTLRADHLSCYGYARATSPRIDALAAAGARFEWAWSTTSWTMPAHLSMLTGLSISAHGMCDERLGDHLAALAPDAVLPLRGTFLPEVLRGAGYATAGFYCWQYLEPRFGFGPGFDVYERIDRTVYSEPELFQRFQALRAANDREELERWRQAEPELFDDQKPTADDAVLRASAWLDKRAERRAAGDDRPFFLFVHLFDVHDEYVPPAPFDRKFTDPAYSGPIDGRHVTSPGSPVRPDMSAADLEQLVALYDGEIAWTDSQVGRLLDRLDALGWAQDTIVVLTSDHGEEFFEHGQKTHRNNLHVESARVPLIVRWPGRLPAGTVVAADAGLVDIAPTMYGLAGLVAPDGLSGADLSAELRGEPPAAPREYVSELVLFPAGPERHVALARGRERVLATHAAGGAAQVVRYDLAADPLERGPAETLLPASTAAVELSARMQALRALLLGQRARSRVRNHPAVALQARDVAQLQALGYTGQERPDTGASGASTAGERLCLDGCVWSDP